MMFSALYFLIIGESEISADRGLLKGRAKFDLGNVRADIIDHMKGFDYKDHWSKLCQHGFPDSQARISKIGGHILCGIINK